MAIYLHEINTEKQFVSQNMSVARVRSALRAGIEPQIRPISFELVNETINNDFDVSALLAIVRPTYYSPACPRAGDATTRSFRSADFMHLPIRVSFLLR